MIANMDYICQEKNHKNNLIEIFSEVMVYIKLRLSYWVQRVFMVNSLQAANFSIGSAWWPRRIRV